MGRAAAPDHCLPLLHCRMITAPIQNLRTPEQYCLPLCGCRPQRCWPRPGEQPARTFLRVFRILQGHRSGAGMPGAPWLLTGVQAAAAQLGRVTWRFDCFLLGIQPVVHITCELAVRLVGAPLDLQCTVNTTACGTPNADGCSCKTCPSGSRPDGKGGCAQASVHRLFSSLAATTRIARTRLQCTITALICYVVPSHPCSASRLTNARNMLPTAPAKRARSSSREKTAR